MRRGSGPRVAAASSAVYHSGDGSSLPSCTLLISTLVLVMVTSAVVMYFNAHHHVLMHATASQHSSAKELLRGAGRTQQLTDLKQYVEKLEGLVSHLQGAKTAADDPKAVGNVLGDQDVTSEIPAHHQHSITRSIEAIKDPDGSSSVGKQDQEDIELAGAEAMAEDPITNVDEPTKAWLHSLTSKLQCMWLHCGAIYLYHTRKAAGTSVREILSFAARQWRVPYYETEGIVLHEPLIHYSGVLTVTTLRDPVKRVLSLYWYEHVGWFDGVLHKTEKCKSLREWLNAWRDGSGWKNKFIAKNPGSVYVEVSNYYTKMLSGWRGEALTLQHLVKAKLILRKFDVILLSDWMGDDTQVDAMNALFPGREKASAGKLVQGDFNARSRLTPRLAPDEDLLKDVIRQINEYDLQLWDYAQSLMAYRLKLIVPAIAVIKKNLGMDLHRKFVDSNAAHNAELLAQCKKLKYSISRQVQQSTIGIFQPPGHKGPI